MPRESFLSWTCKSNKSNPSLPETLFYVIVTFLPRIVRAGTISRS